MADEDDAYPESFVSRNGDGNGSGFDISVSRQKGVTDAIEIAQINGYIVQAGVVYIAEDGNVILRFRGKHGKAMIRVASALLITQSTYFRSLLDPSRGFAEAQKLNSAVRSSAERLPVIELDFPSDPSFDESEWPVNVTRLAHFFSLLHDHRSLLGGFETQKTDDIFFLALCWDRFVVNQDLNVASGNQFVAKPKSKKKLYQPSGLDWQSWELRHETECRKLIFAAHRLGFKDQLAVLTQKLIVMGSQLHNHWLAEGEVEGYDSVIWHLPASLEEEIFTRRRTMLAKVSIVLDRYITQYTSGSLQCRWVRQFERVRYLSARTDASLPQAKAYRRLQGCPDSSRISQRTNHVR